MTDEVSLDDLLTGVVAGAAALGTRLLVALVVGGLVVLLGSAVRPLVRRALERGGRPSRTRVFLALYRMAVTVLAIILATTLAFPSVEVVDVLGSLGIVSVAAGFAFKDVLENLLAGVLLLLRDPFMAGDQIRVGDHEGTVEGVTIRETLLRTYDGQRVLIPNAQVYTGALEVLTHYPATRSAFRLSLDIDTDLEHARAAVLPALREIAPPGSEPELLVVGLDRGALEVEVRVWGAPSRADRTKNLDAAMTATVTALRAAGVLFDRPTTVLVEGDD